MTETKIYHIYAKDKCVLHSIKEEEFHLIWNNIFNLLKVLDTNYSEKDLSFEELTVSKETSLNSSY